MIGFVAISTQGKMARLDEIPLTGKFDFYINADNSVCRCQLIGHCRVVPTCSLRNSIVSDAHLNTDVTKHKRICYV
jgi:hypothetical protein